MTNHEYVMLCNAATGAFMALAKEYGCDVAGPSVSGAFLIRDSNAKAWLFGGPQGRMGRVCTPSVWTELNVERMARR